MTVGDFLRDAAATLSKTGITTTRLDCLVLLEDVLGQDRTLVLAHPETKLSKAQLSILNNFVAQRKTHVPLAYIRGHVAFFGRKFIVNNTVLVPRPETEGIIELLKETPLPAHPRIADVGTGSGCIGITAALEIPDAEVFLYDISQDALEVATKNAQLNKVAVHVCHSNLLDDVVEQFDVVLANLPYVPDDHAINSAAAFEPKLALFAGEDGLDLYRRLWEQLATLSHQPQHVFTEAMPEQHLELTRLAEEAGYVPGGNRGFIQHFVLSH